MVVERDPTYAQRLLGPVGQLDPPAILRRRSISRSAASASASSARHRAAPGGRRRHGPKSPWSSAAISSSPARAGLADPAREPRHPARPRRRRGAAVTGGIAAALPLDLDRRDRRRLARPLGRGLVRRLRPVARVPPQGDRPGARYIAGEMVAADRVGRPVEAVRLADGTRSPATSSSTPPAPGRARSLSGSASICRCAPASAPCSCSTAPTRCRAARWSSTPRASGCGPRGATSSPASRRRPTATPTHPARGRPRALRGDDLAGAGRARAGVRAAPRRQAAGPAITSTTRSTRTASSAATPISPTSISPTASRATASSRAPPSARGLAELIRHGRYLTLDLTPLGLDRLHHGPPLIERNII